MQNNRLSLYPLSEIHADFIIELVNSPGWLKFIGERNVKNQADALAYIQRILANEHVKYQVVTRLEDSTPLGIITLIKRDYLEHHDFGFAFLPRFEKQGYALEAPEMVLQKLRKQAEYAQLLAITIPENEKSIRLLEKLGFRYEREKTDDKETLHVYLLA